jgi:hypothetical protein
MWQQDVVVHEARPTSCPQGDTTSARVRFADIQETSKIRVRTFVARADQPRISATSCTISTVSRQTTTAPNTV